MRNPKPLEALIYCIEVKAFTAAVEHIVEITLFSFPIIAFSFSTGAPRCEATRCYLWISRKECAQVNELRMRQQIAMFALKVCLES